MVLLWLQTQLCPLTFGTLGIKKSYFCPEVEFFMLIYTEQKPKIPITFFHFYLLGSRQVFSRQVELQIFYNIQKEYWNGNLGPIFIVRILMEDCIVNNPRSVF